MKAYMTSQLFFVPLFYSSFYFCPYHDVRAFYIFLSYIFKGKFTWSCEYYNDKMNLAGTKMPVSDELSSLTVGSRQLLALSLTKTRSQNCQEYSIMFASRNHVG